MDIWIIVSLVIEQINHCIAGETLQKVEAASTPPGRASLPGLLLGSCHQGIAVLENFADDTKIQPDADSHGRPDVDDTSNIRKKIRKFFMILDGAAK